MSRPFLLSFAMIAAACGGVSADDDPDAGPSADAQPGSDAAAPDAGDVAPNIAFITSTQHSGSIGGLSGADSICNAAAGGAGLEGSYVAWLSSASADARDRLGSASAWVRPDGRAFAASKDDLLAGRLLYPAVLDEAGRNVAGFIWTATLSDGTYWGNGDCADWTGTAGSAQLGESTGGMTQFTAANENSCAEPARLLCLGVDRAGQIEPPADTGRLAFVTEGMAAGNQGIAVFDALCASEASDAGFAGVFGAAVYLDGLRIAERFDVGAETWVRTDGVKLFESAADLEAATTLAPLQVGADGTHYDTAAWTGQSPGIPRNCADFTDGTLTGIGGTSSLSGTRTLFGVTFSCATPLPIYCLER